MTEGNVMELDCTTIRTLALALFAWVFVSAPIGVILGKAIHAAQHEAGAPITSDATDHQA